VPTGNSKEHKDIETAAQVRLKISPVGYPFPSSGQGMPREQEMSRVNT